NHPAHPSPPSRGPRLAERADYPEPGLPPVDLMDRALRQGHHEQVAVRTGLDVGHDPEVRPDEQALALGDVELVAVVCDPVGQPRVVDGDLPAVAGQVEMEQVPLYQEGA